MLERAASTCLNSSTRHIARHQLHKSFYHHGARDVIESSSSRAGTSHHGNVQQEQAPLLDFLYPPKTLALMRRISGYGTCRGGVGRATVNSRTFTSSVRTASSKQKASSAHLIASLTNEKPDPKYTTANPMEKLKHLLKKPLPAHSQSDDYETVWQLYLQLAPEQRTQRIFVGLINHLSFSTRSQDVIRSAWLIEESPLLKSQNQNDRSATRFWAALVQQLRLGNAEAALDIHQNAIDSKAEGYIGTNLLLAQLLQAKEWDLALHIFNSKMATIADANKGWLKDDRADLWDFVDRLPNLLPLTSAVLAQRNTGPQLEDRYAKDFLQKLIVKAVVQGLQSKADRKTCKLIRDIISQHGSRIPDLHDVVMKQLLLVLKSTDIQAPNYLDLSQLLADLLDMSKTTGHYHANDRLLFDTAVIMAKSAPLAARSRWWGFSHSKFSKKVVEIMGEYEELVGIDRSYGLKTAAMRMHAKLGNIKEVVQLFDRMSLERPMAEITALPVLELFANQAEAGEAQVFFERLRDEFMWQPTTRCWNTLLRALARADNIAQGVSYFEEMMVADVELDAHSYLPILQLYSRRGESAKIVSLLEMAQSNNIEMDAKMFYYLVVAHLENGDLAAAEEAAQALIQARKQGNIAGPITIVWNALLEAFGRQRDWTNVMRIYNSMVEANVAPDTQTRAALLEAMCNMHNTGEAWKLLQGLHKQNKRDTIPAHYREVMLGFINQRQPLRALAVYDRMCEVGIKPDGAIIALHTRAKSLHEAHDVDPNKAEMQIVEQKFTKKLGEATEVAPSDPGKGNREVLGGAREAVAASLIMNYGSANQADNVSKWFDLYMESQDARGNADLQPMTILRALMTSFLHAGNDAELEKCWEEYVQQAEIFAANISAPKAEDGGVEESSIPPPPPLYSSRRHLLSAPLVLYMKSLSSQGKRAKIKSTVLSLVKRGWKLDNIAWNEYVRCLVAHTGLGDSLSSEPSTATRRTDAEDGVISAEEAARAEIDSAGFGDFPMDLKFDGPISIPKDGVLVTNGESAATDTISDVAEPETLGNAEIPESINMNADIQAAIEVFEEKQAWAESLEANIPTTEKDITESSQEISQHPDSAVDKATIEKSRFQSDVDEVQPPSQVDETDSTALAEENANSDPAVDVEPTIHPETDIEASQMETELRHPDATNPNTMLEAEVQENQQHSKINLNTAENATAKAEPEIDTLDEIQDDPSPSDILTAFRVCEAHLMPNFPGWVDLARPLHASERRGKYAGGLYWMKTENLGRKLYQGLLVPQFDTLAALRDTINELERKAFAEEFEDEGDEVGVFGKGGQAIIEEAKGKAWGDEEWGLGDNAKLELEKKKIAREEAEMKKQQEVESRERLAKVILEKGEVPNEVEEKDIHVPADTLLEAVRTWAPQAVDAAMLIPTIVVPEGFGKYEEMSKKRGWMWKMIKGWVRQTKSIKVKLEKATKEESEAVDEVTKAEARKSKELFEGMLRGLEEGPRTWTFKDGGNEAWLRRIGEREKYALRQALRKRGKRDNEYRIAYPTDRKGKALFIVGDGEPLGSNHNDYGWLQEMDDAEEERKREVEEEKKKDEFRQRELDREFKRMAEQERRAIEGGELFDDGRDSSNDRMKRSKRRLAKDKKKKKGGEGEAPADVGDALSALEKGDS